MSDIETFEVMLVSWSKSTSKRSPMVTFALSSDEDCEFFEALTTAKGKTAGQIMDIAVSLSEQDTQHNTLTAKETTVVQHAAMLCREPEFQSFLEDVAIRRGMSLLTPIKSVEDAADTLRELCGVESRRELLTDEVARGRFDAIWDAYEQQKVANYGLDA